MRTKLSMVAASALAIVGIQSASANVSNVASKPSDTERNLRNKVHAKDLQTRLQVVCDRFPARETVDLYGTNPNGFGQHKKLTRAEYRKLQDKRIA